MTTKMTFLLALCLVTGMLMIACGGAADNTATTNTATTNTATTNTTTTTTTTTTSADKIGVAECDEYIAKVETCLGKVPAAGQAAVKSSLDMMRKAWRDAAATPQGKAGLATGCKAALDQAKTTMGSYGCSW
ncbi:MAG: hypothetical protein H7Z38_08770 [Rubrivivax sp.]|nr:hypothetical protein [Pyrinomonadaceae bacterium]